MFRIRATTDIDDAQLVATVVAWQYAGEAEAAAMRPFFRSFEPPTWIQVVADAAFWKGVFGAATFYVVQGTLNEIGAGAWRQRKVAVARALALLNVPLVAVGKDLAAVGATLNRRTKLQLSIPFTDEWFGATLTLDGRDWEGLICQIGLFAVHTPKLDALLKKEGLADTPGQGPVDLTLLDDGSLQVHWMDRRTLETRTVVLTLPR